MTRFEGAKPLVLYLVNNRPARASSAVTPPLSNPLLPLLPILCLAPDGGQRWPDDGLENSHDSPPVCMARSPAALAGDGGQHLA